MATKNSEALRLIRAANESGSTAAFSAASDAVEALPPSAARTQYRAAVRRLPLHDRMTWIIARGAELTLDMNRNTPQVVGGDDGSVVVAVRRAEADPPTEPAAAIEALAIVDTESGALTASRLAVTSHDAQVGTIELPITDGRLDVAAVRGWSDPMRRACAIPVALIAPPQL